MNDAEVSQYVSERANSGVDDEFTPELISAYIVRYTMRHQTSRFVSDYFRTFFKSPEEAQQFIDNTPEHGRNVHDSFAVLGYTDIKFDVVTMVEAPF